MAQFMLFVRGGENSGADLTPAQAQAARDPYSQWAGKLHAEGKLVHAAEIDGKFMRLSRSDEHIVAEGPLPGLPDGVHGYFIFRADDEQKALTIARACPILDHGGVAELHRIVD